MVARVVNSSETSVVAVIRHGKSGAHGRSVHGHARFRASCGRQLAAVARARAQSPERRLLPQFDRRLAHVRRGPRSNGGTCLSVLMKAPVALLALLMIACGGGESSVGPTAPTAPTAPTGPTAPTQVDGGQLFTYQNAVAFLPTGVANYRAAIVFLPGLRDPATGNDLDSRALVGGTSGAGCSIWCSPAERAEVRSRALKLVGGEVALIGTTTQAENPASYETLLRALSEFGTQSQHPELANIPILFVGHSMGGCTAYGFSRVHGARVAGFLTMKGGCHSPGSAAAAAGVPGHFLIGELDEQYRRANITDVFETGRAAGAPWAISIDPFHHGPIVDFDLMFDWIDAVLAARLPMTPGAPLRATAVTDGWLGDRSTGAISTYACFSSTRSGASWLPSEETALDWQRLARGSGVVRGC